MNELKKSKYNPTNFKKLMEKMEGKVYKDFILNEPFNKILENQIKIPLSKLNNAQDYFYVLQDVLEILENNKVFYRALNRKNKCLLKDFTQDIDSIIKKIDEIIFPMENNINL